MQAKTKKYLVVGVAAGVLLTVALTIDYLVRCRGEPLTREEALLRATSKLSRFSKSFNVGSALPALVHEQYESDIKTWTFTYANPTCTVAIVADKCRGTDIGGTDGCPPR
jgi:hypothetical protein